MTRVRQGLAMVALAIVEAAPARSGPDEAATPPLAAEETGPCPARPGRRRRAGAGGHQRGHAPGGADGGPGTALLGQLNKEVAGKQGFLALHAPAGAYFFQAELGLKAGKALIFQVFLGPVVLVGAALDHIPGGATG